MVVIVHRNQIIFGKKRSVPEYLPAGSIPTPQRREAAEKLDLSIRNSVEKINNEYEGMVGKFNDSMDKWRWLGGKISEILVGTEKLERIDIDNNTIWPAINQYLCHDLKRGFDAKRTGTAKDHLRKVWLLATLPNTDWFDTWTGWDAFIDRGESLITEVRILAAVKKAFPPESIKMKKNDYQKIARWLVEILSSRKGQALNFSLLTDSEIQNAVNQAKNKFMKLNDN